MVCQEFLQKSFKGVKIINFILCGCGPTRSSIVVISAGKVFHRRGSNNVRCFCLQLLGSGGILASTPRRPVTWNSTFELLGHFLFSIFHIFGMM